MVSRKVFVVVIENIRRVFSGNIVARTCRLNLCIAQSQDALLRNITVIVLQKNILCKKINIPRIRVQKSLCWRNSCSVNPAVFIVTEQTGLLPEKDAGK